MTDSAEARDVSFLDRLSAPEMPRLVVAERFGKGSRLVLIGEDGRRVRDLTEATDGVMDITPAWSPDGRWIAFASSRGREHPGATSIWVVPVMGGDAIRLTGEAAIDLAPAWHPGGRRLVFERAPAGSAELDLWQVEFDGTRSSGERRLTSDEGSERMASFSPDGTKLAYVVDVVSEPRIVVARTDGSKPRLVATGTWPAFSPDGESVAFVARAEGRPDTDLFVVPAEGGRTQVLVDSSLGDESMPRWSSDGRFVIASAVAFAEIGEDRKPFWWTVVVAAPGGEPHALDEETPVLRAGAAVAPVPLDAERLLATPTYRSRVENVARAMFQ